MYDTDIKPGQPNGKCITQSISNCVKYSSLNEKCTQCKTGMTVDTKQNVCKNWSWEKISKWFAYPI